MNDNGMKSQDKGITKECRQNFSQVKFSIHRLVLSAQIIDKLSKNVKERIDTKEKQYVQLKLQFICVESKTILKQIKAKASIRQFQKNYQNTLLGIYQTQQTLMKVQYDDYENSEVLIKVYMRFDNQQSEFFQYICELIINLQEINKNIKEMIRYCANRKRGLQQFFKRYKISNYSLRQDKQQINKYTNVYEKNQRRKHSAFYQQFKPQQKKSNENSYLQIKVFHSYSLCQVMQLFRLNKNKKPKQVIKSYRNDLKVIKSFHHHKVFHKNSHAYLNPNYLQSTRSQFTLQTQSIQNLIFNKQKFTRVLEQRVNKINEIKSNKGQINHKKTFKQKIYELLQQVRSLKKDFKIQMQENIKNSQSIKIKNIYCMISSKSYQQLKSIERNQKKPQVYQSFESNVVNSIVQVTSFPSIRQSKSEQIINTNKIQFNLSKNKYQMLFQIQNRLKNHQKIVALSSQFLNKIQQPENPQKIKESL